MMAILHLLCALCKELAGRGDYSQSEWTYEEEAYPGVFELICRTERCDYADRVFVFTLGSGETKELLRGSILELLNCEVDIDPRRDRILVVEHGEEAFSNLRTYFNDCIGRGEAVGKTLGNGCAREVYLIGLSRGAVTGLLMACRVASYSKCDVHVIAMSPAIAQPDKMMREMVDLADIYPSMSNLADCLKRIAPRLPPTPRSLLVTLFDFTVMHAQILGAGRLLPALDITDDASIAATAYNIATYRHHLALWQTREFWHLREATDNDLHGALRRELTEIAAPISGVKSVTTYFGTKDEAIPVDKCVELIECWRIGREATIARPITLDDVPHAMTRSHLDLDPSSPKAPARIWSEIFTRLPKREQSDG